MCPQPVQMRGVRRWSKFWPWPTFWTLSELTLKKFPPEYLYVVQYKQRNIFSEWLQGREIQKVVNTLYWQVQQSKHPPLKSSCLLPNWQFPGQINLTRLVQLFNDIHQESRGNSTILTVMKCRDLLNLFMATWVEKGHAPGSFYKIFRNPLTVEVNKV